MNMLNSRATERPSSLGRRRSPSVPSSRPSFPRGPSRAIGKSGSFGGMGSLFVFV